jgi:predicted NACHT family NTPase
VHLDVQLADKPSAVERPIDRLVQDPRSIEPRLLSADNRITSIFDQNIGQLLILGASGSGKTILFLELSEALLIRARKDRAQPIPVVFILSSWAAKRLPLAEWLVAELNNLYGVDHELARSWIDKDSIIPLLDGLDEVASAHREACVHAINAFHKNRGFLPIVVCCRSEVYESLSKRSVKLQLQAAVELQPLGLRSTSAPVASLLAACNKRSIAIPGYGS